MAQKSSKEESAYTLAGLTIDLYQKLRNEKVSLSQLSGFNNLPENEREQLSRGNYRVIKKEGRIITLPAVNGSILPLFSEHKEGDDAQFHWDSFKVLILQSSHIYVDKMKIQECVFEESVSDVKIMKHLGGEEKVAFKNMAIALRVLASSMTDEYRYGKAVFVYYYDSSDMLSCIYCNWDDSDSCWNCNAAKCDHSSLSGSSRRIVLFLQPNIKNPFLWKGFVYYIDFTLQ